MSDESPRLAAVEKDSEVEIQGVEGSRATLLREPGSPSLSGWSAQSQQWLVPSTQTPAQTSLGLPKHKPATLDDSGWTSPAAKNPPYFLQLSEAE